MEDASGVNRTVVSAPSAPAAGACRRGIVLIAVAIVLTGLNLRTAVNSIGPVLEEIQDGLGPSGGLAGLVTALPVLCFATLGFAGPRCRHGSATRTS